MSWSCAKKETSRMSSITASSKNLGVTDFLPTELPERPAGWYGTPIIAGKLGSEYEHHTEWATPRRRAITISRMLRTSAVLVGRLRTQHFRKSTAQENN